MKKLLLSFLLALCTALPARGALPGLDDCEFNIQVKYYQSDADVESDPLYQQVYKEEYDKAKQRYEDYLNTKITKTVSGDCRHLGGRSYSYTCTAGQTNRDCMPQPCTLQYDDTAYPDVFSNNVKEVFVNKKIDIECKQNKKSGTTTKIPENPNDLNDARTDVDKMFAPNDDAQNSQGNNNSGSNNAAAAAPVVAAAAGNTITVTGRVVDENGDGLPSAHVFPTGNPGTGTPTDMDGSFTLNVPANTRSLTISFTGFITVERAPSANMGTIKMTPEDKQLQDVTVVAENCQTKVKTTGVAAYAAMECGGKSSCIPSQCTTSDFTLTGGGTCNATCKLTCDGPRYAPNAAGTACEDQAGKDCTPTGTRDPMAESYFYEWDATKKTLNCVIRSCKSNGGQRYVQSSDKTKCELTSGPCTDAQIKAIPHATVGLLKNGKCYPSQCEAGYEPKDTACVAITCDGPRYVLNSAKTACDDLNGTECQVEESKRDPHAQTYQYKYNKKDNTMPCLIVACKADGDIGYTPSDDGTKCEQGGGPCTEEQIKAIPHATGGTFKKGQCYPTCEKGYQAKDTVCEAIPQLSKEDAEKRRQELQENADKMKEKETNLVSRLTGAAALGGGGIGGQQILSGLAEQSSDEAAERDMRAYLETFRCDYGQGKTIRGGETAIELPGGNELFDLYVEYGALAESLKTRKNALGLRAGIESEVVIDKAETGLYDNAATGISGGTYASVARAILDPEGEDAQRWAKQKSDASAKLKRGAVIAGVGLAAGIAGNIYNEAKYGSNQSKAILAKYEPLKKVFDDTQRDIDSGPATKSCSEFSGAAGTYPNCTCNDNAARFFPDNGGCVKCDDGMEYNANNQCVKKGCTKTGNAVNVATCECATGAVVAGDTCNCADNYTLNTEGTACVLKSAGNVLGDLIPTVPGLDLTPTTPNQDIATLKLYADKKFETGKYDLTSAAKAELATFAGKVKEETANLDGAEYCLIIVGHTDRTKFRNDPKNAKNYALSENRANAVKSVLETNGIATANMTTSGKADEECTRDKYTKDNDPDCRRVDVTLRAGACGTGGGK